VCRKQISNGRKPNWKRYYGRLRNQPGVILADEVGMGKTFVALAVAYSIAQHSPRGAVIVMVPANLIDKWYKT